MALRFLCLQEFRKQITKNSIILNYLSSQSGSFYFTSSTTRARSSQPSVNLDQTLKADSSVNSEIKASNGDPKTGTQNAVYKKKLHHRVLTLSEMEDEKKWKGTKLDLQESDSFGDIWKEKQRNVPKLDYSKAQREITKKKEKNFKQKISEETQKLKKEANTFGNLSDDHSLLRLVEDVREQRFLDDESDAKEGRTHIRLSKVRRFQEPYWYAKQISKLGKEGKVLEAIDMLEETMLKRDRVMPTTYVFNQLFGILGNVGYTKKAFQLFNKMKKMGIRPDGHTYTCLFNCCSNSPWSNDGLQRTHNLHQLIKDKNVTLHPITFKAMIKAYGVCGDIQGAFQAADEMCKLHPPDQQLYSFLLMACVSDTQTGLKHAVKVWQLMRKMNIKPDLPLYNLLLRVIRDSGFGISEDVKKFPQSRNLQCKETTNGHQDSIQHPEEEQTDKELIIKTESNVSENTAAVNIRESNVLATLDLASNLFGDSPIINTSLDLRYPENRLAVFGGPLAILEDMKKNGVSPNVLTFTQLLDSLPQKNEAELQLLEYMKAENVRRDIDLYNMIIRRRNRRNDYQAATEVLKYIVEEGIFLNLRTFGCLAMGCTTLPKAKRLLQSIDEAGLEPNIEIFGLFAYKSALDFEYKEALLGMLKKRNLYPNVIFLQHLERSIQSARKKILKMERNEIVDDYFKSEKFKSSFENFMMIYSKWLKSIGFDKPEHPWKDFRHPKEEDSQKDVQS